MIKPYFARVAGVAITSNRPLTMVPEPLLADCACALAFDAEPGRGVIWHAIPTPEATLGAFIAESGRAAVIGCPGATAEEIAAQARLVAPFAAALQGQLTLHASSVRRGAGVHAFVAGSGAGKSTWARALAAMGLERVSDDLLPVRSKPAGWYVPLRFGALPLASVSFIGRGAADSNLERVPLAPREALLAHLRDGFGELACPDIWARQFAGYSALAQAVPSFRLLVPDDLSGLGDHARRWMHAA